MRTVLTKPGPGFPGPGTNTAGPLLQIADLSVEFRMRRGTTKAVNGVSFSVSRGETLAILGESGSGKSITTQAAMGLVPSPPGFITGGKAVFDGVDLLTISPKKRRKYMGERISMIYQSVSLNPCFTVGWQIAEMFRVHRGASRGESMRRAVELLERVGIPEPAERAKAYPHQFSGGMRQRVTIAMAVALDPELLIADEPTTALDVTVQAQIMQVLKDLQAETNMAVILITHDLEVAAENADQAVVMYAGRVMESGPAEQVLLNPRHPYTLALLRSAPSTATARTRLDAIPGSPPDAGELLSGCPFHPRCFMATDRCATETPPQHQLSGHRASACHYYEEVHRDV
jgi:oligopeptide transport system ATP-binding protein